MTRADLAAMVCMVLMVAAIGVAILVLGSGGGHDVSDPPTNDTLAGITR